MPYIKLSYSGYSACAQCGWAFTPREKGDEQCVLCMSQANAGRKWVYDELEPNRRQCANPTCTNEFMVDPKKASAKYCGDSCRRTMKNQQQSRREYEYKHEPHGRNSA